MLWLAGTWPGSRTRRRSPSHSRWRARASAWRAWRRGPPAGLSGAGRSAEFILILSANYLYVIIIAIIDMFLSSLQSVKIFSSSIYVSNELSTIRNNYSECRAKGEDWPGPEEYWPGVSWFESFYLSESEYFCSILQVLQLRCSRHSDNQVRGLVDVSHRSSSYKLSLKTVPKFINPSDMLQPTQCTTQRSLKTKMRKFSVKTKLSRNFSWTFTIFSMVTCSNNNQSIMQEEDWIQDFNIMKIKNLFLAADLYLHLQNLADGWRNPYSL